MKIYLSLSFRLLVIVQNNLNYNPISEVLVCSIFLLSSFLPSLSSSPSLSLSTIHYFLSLFCFTLRILSLSVSVGHIHIPCHHVPTLLLRYAGTPRTFGDPLGSDVLLPRCGELLSLSLSLSSLFRYNSVLIYNNFFR